MCIRVDKYSGERTSKSDIQYISQNISIENDSHENQTCNTKIINSHHLKYYQSNHNETLYLLLLHNVAHGFVSRKQCDLFNRYMDCDSQQKIKYNFTPKPIKVTAT